MNRSLLAVLMEMIKVIPDDFDDRSSRFKKELEAHLKQTSYLAPELHGYKWEQVCKDLNDFVLESDKPHSCWECQMLSIFTMRDISEIREELNGRNV